MGARKASGKAEENEGNTASSTDTPKHDLGKKKQEEVELCMYLPSYSITGITRMCWGRLT